MHIAPLISFVAIAAAGVANAQVQINFRTYPNTIACSGSWFGCTTVGGTCCGPMPSGWGYSAEFVNIPSGAIGRGYTDPTCYGAYSFTLYGPGTKCWSGGGSSRMRAIRWGFTSGPVTGPSRRAIGNSTDGDIGEGGDGECTAPSAFHYADDKGVERTIKVPQEAGAAEVVARLYENKDWAALQKYEDYEKA